MKVLQLTLCIFYLLFSDSLKTSAQLDEEWIPDKILQSPKITTKPPVSNKKESPIIKVREIKSIGEKATRFDISVNSSNVILKKDMKRVELICSSPRPIKWEYFVNDISIPVLQVQYRRMFSSKIGESNDFDDVDLRKEENNGFEGRVVLRGLLESQSGKYVCSFYNEKFVNNSYENSANLTVFVPGKKVFTTLFHINYISTLDKVVVISCPISNPEVIVAIYKFNEELFNQTNEIEWEQITANYNPSVGFEIEEGREIPSLFGTYKCVTIGKQKSITIHVADSSLKESLYDSVVKTRICWENPNCMKFLRSKRLECFCKNSFALFTTNLEGHEENLKGNCTNLKNALEGIPNFPERDWRTEEFLRNGEESEGESCFKDKVRQHFNGSGTRVILRVVKKMSDINHGITNLTITFDGLYDWASGHKIGIEYFPTGESQGRSNPIKILNREPTTSQNFPLAHTTTIWKNVVVNGEKVRSVHVFQPDSFSFQWFQISSLVVDATIDGKLCDEEINSSCSSEVMKPFPFAMALLIGLGAVLLIIGGVCAILYYLRNPRVIKYYPCEKVTIL